MEFLLSDVGVALTYSYVANPFPKEHWNTDQLWAADKTHSGFLDIAFSYWKTRPPEYTRYLWRL